MIGKTLDGRYHILSLLGEGGMGKVYLAEHVVLGKRMAVKVLHEQFSRQEDVVKRFQQEAITASSIGQENIVNITDFGRTAEGALFFVMEELQGQNLNGLTRCGPVPLSRLLHILAQVARALAAAHSRGIVHRDLKPENVILLQTEERPDFVKVLDFGISKVGTDTGKKLTRVGVIMGTPEYMAPEQAAGATVDHRADIYSLGVMAYEMATGALPFAGEHALQVLLKHQSEQPLPPRQRAPELSIPESLERLILRALAKAPEGRQQHMTEVAAELSKCQEELGLKPAPVLGLGLAVAPNPRTGEVALSLPERPSGTLQLEEVREGPSGRGSNGTLQLANAASSAPIPLVRVEAAERSEPPVPAQPPAPSPVVLRERIGGVAPAGTAQEVDLLATQRLEVPSLPHTGGEGRRTLLLGAILALLVGAAGAATYVGKHPSGGPASWAAAGWAQRGWVLGGRAEEGRAPGVGVERQSGASVPAPPLADPLASLAYAPQGSEAPKPTAPFRVLTHRVQLRSVPEGAVILENGAPVGTTPMEVEVRRPTTFRFALSGYRSAARKVTMADDRVEVPLSKVAVHRRRPKEELRQAGDDLKEDPFR